MNMWLEDRCVMCGVNNIVNNGDPDDLTIGDVQGFVCYNCGNKNKFTEENEDLNEYEDNFVCKKGYPVPGRINNIQQQVVKISGQPYVISTWPNQSLPNPDFCINYDEVKSPDSSYSKVHKLGEDKYHILKTQEIQKLINQENNQ